MKEFAFPVFAAFGILFALLPLTWHYRSRNHAVLFLLFWIGIWNLVLFINAVTWINSAEVKNLIWCDISGKIIQMAGIAVPTATFCIARKLEGIASTRQVASTGAEVRRRLVFDIICCLGLPLVFGALTAVYQGHRMDVYEGVGCVVPVYFSWPYIVFGLLPCLAVSFASLIYSVLAMRWFLLRRRQFAAVLSSAGSNLDRGRYLRMICFCAIDMVVTTPITIGLMIAVLVESKGQLQPYPSWDYVHLDFGNVLQISAVDLDAMPKVYSRIELGRWVAPISAFLFFGILGVMKDARAEYRRLALAVWNWRSKKQSTQPPILVQVQRSVDTDNPATNFSGDDKDIELQDKGLDSPIAYQHTVSHHLT